MTSRWNKNVVFVAPSRVQGTKVIVLTFTIILLYSNQQIDKEKTESQSSYKSNKIAQDSQPIAMANSRLRGLTWWMKWAKKEWAIAALGFSLIIFLFTLISDSWSRRDDSNLNNPFDHTHDLVDLTLLRNAKNTGACT